MTLQKVNLEICIFIGSSSFVVFRMFTITVFKISSFFVSKKYLNDLVMLRVFNIVFKYETNAI